MLNDLSLRHILYGICLVIFTGVSVLSQELAGFGNYEHRQTEPCISDAERTHIKQELNKSIQQLKAEGRLKLPRQNGTVTFIEPIRTAPGVDAFQTYGTSNFVDHNGNANALQDYQCGTRTYDTPSYNHSGVDYFGWPFGWYQMDNDQVEIIAAADGVIIQKFDGWFDRNCSFNGSQWNAIYLMHSDSTVTWYGHLKANSVTSKIAGESVVAGEYLGIMGSSGNSTGPHLHFEVYDASGNLQDPFAGPCNNLNTSSMWQNQTSYYDAGINQLLLHSALPVFPACPTQEVVNIKETVAPGELTYFASYYRDHQQGQRSDFSILRPDGTVWVVWDHTQTAPYFNASYYAWTWILPTNAEAGTWTWRAEFQGVVYDKTFIVNSPTGIGDEPENMAIPQSLELSQNYPNPFNPTTIISYSLPERTSVRLRVYNTAGQEVADLVNANQSAGNYSIDFDAANLPSGSYLYRLTTSAGTITNKMTLLK
ncbi:MAG: peptidoglycan DD-metalloendopeptidase family protein [Calditrichia bacterium]